MSEGWWYRASTEQKLAQVDGGIECGLTARQIALFSGIDPDKSGPSGNTVRAFALFHGRRFPEANLFKAGRNRKRGRDLKREYYTGAREFGDMAMLPRVRNGEPEEVAFE